MAEKCVFWVVMVKVQYLWNYFFFRLIPILIGVARQRIVLHPPIDLAQFNTGCLSWRNPFKSPLATRRGYGGWTLAPPSTGAFGITSNISRNKRGMLGKWTYFPPFCSWPAAAATPCRGLSSSVPHPRDLGSYLMTTIFFVKKCMHPITGLSIHVWTEICTYKVNNMSLNTCVLWLLFS